MADRHITSFYAPPGSIAGDTVTLPEEEGRHAVRVLRMRAGDEIQIVDGKGGSYRAILSSLNPQNVVASIVEKTDAPGEPTYDLAIAIGLLKSRSRFETFVEKAVELGVSRIVPLVVERSEETGLNRRRTEAIVLAAMKQSGRSRLTAVDDPLRLEEALLLRDNNLICHEKAATTDTFWHAASDLRGTPLMILIGPEGGFTQAEVSLAAVHHAAVVSLGPRRLRAETAGIVAASIVMSLHETIR